ncbi:MAG: response regulator [bacterium]
MPRMKPVVLFVEDEPEILGIVGDIFRSSRMKVICTQSGKQALQLADQQDLAVVVCDLILKDISGLEVLSHFKKNHPQTYRILTTGFLDAKQEKKCMELGIFQTLIPKPWDIFKFREKMDAVIENSFDNGKPGIAESRSN